MIADVATAGGSAVRATAVSPYAAAIAQACREVGADPFLVAGLGLRETEMGWSRLYRVPPGRERWDGWGDHDHGYGLFQIDDRSWPEWCAAAPHPPLEQARQALRVLAQKRAWLARHLPDLTGSDLLHASLAAYNAGEGNVFHAIQSGRGCDTPTAHGDYGLDVLRRTAALRRDAPDLFAATEVA